MFPHTLLFQARREISEAHSAIQEETSNQALELLKLNLFWDVWTMESVVIQF